MSSDLNQNGQYTILTGNNDTITLFWVDYLDKAGIRPWYFIQTPWYYDGDKAMERYWNLDIGALTGPKFE